MSSVDPVAPRKTDSLVYIIRDKVTAQLLKVGETGAWEGRFIEYVRRAREEGRSVVVTVFKIGAKTTLDRVAIERQIRLTLMEDGHLIPWDATRIGKHYLKKP